MGRDRRWPLRQPVFSAWACAGLALMLQFGCVDLPKVDTGQAKLYVFDGRTHDLLAWDDVPAIYDGSSAPTANRTISSGKLAGLTIGAGGMAMNGSSQRLYLVGTNGTVVRIDRIGQHNGIVPSADVISCTLKDQGTDITDGTFGQAALSATGDTLYVTETSASGDKSQLWAVPVSNMYADRQITNLLATVFATTSNTGDRNGTGVAAASGGMIYAYFQTGNTISSGGLSYDGPRLRRGTSGQFPSPGNPIVGDTSITLLGKYGCLAYDNGNDVLYLARHNTDSGLSGNSLLAFKPDKFSPGLDTPPTTTLVGPANLRLLAHANQKDWLVGAGSAGPQLLWIWKAPSQGDTSVNVVLPDTAAGAVQILGLALDGSD